MSAPDQNGQGARGTEGSYAGSLGLLRSNVALSLIASSGCNDLELAIAQTSEIHLKSIGE